MPPKRPKLCARCKGVEDPAMAGHSMLGCKRNDAKISDLWPEFPDIGNDNDASLVPQDSGGCKKFLKDLNSNTKTYGRPPTKCTLEAYRTVAKSNVIATTANPSTTTTTSSHNEQSALAHHEPSQTLAQPSQPPPADETVSEPPSQPQSDNAAMTEDQAVVSAFQTTRDGVTTAHDHSRPLPSSSSNVFGGVNLTAAQPSSTNQPTFNQISGGQGVEQAQTGLGNSATMEVLHTGPPASSSNSGTSSATARTEKPPPPWKMTFTKRPTPKDDNKEFDAPDNGPVNKVTTTVKGNKKPGEAASTTVVTNYVAVEKIPETVYVYSIKHGGSRSASQHFPAMGGVAAALPSTSQQPNNPHAAQNLPPSFEMKRRSEKSRVWDTLRTDQRFAIFSGRTDWATDFDTFWTLKPLSSAGLTQLGSLYQVQSIPYVKSSGRDASLEDLTFTLTRVLAFDTANKALSLVKTDAPVYKGASMYIAALNGLLSKHATSNRSSVISVGPNKFFLQDGFRKLPMDFLNVNRGYFSSVRPGSERVLLNVGTKAGAFYQVQRVSDCVDAMSDRKHVSEYDYSKLLIGRSVRICYERAKHEEHDPNLDRNRHKVIAGFGEIPSQQTFQLGGKTITVRDYFVNRLRAQEPSNRHRCVNVGLAPKKGQGTGASAKQPITKSDDAAESRELWIPADFLEIDADQPFNHLLSPSHMEQMLRAAQHPPVRTRRLIAKEGLRFLGITHENVTLAQLHMAVNPNLLQIPASILKVPTILYHVSSKTVTAASWNLKNVKFFSDGREKCPDRVLGLDTTPDTANKPSVSQVAYHLARRLTDHGLRVRNPDGNVAQTLQQLEQGLSGRQVPRRPLDSFTDDELYNMMKKPMERVADPRLLLVLLPDGSSTNYGKVKRVCDQRLGVHTVCVTSGKCKPQPRESEKQQIRVLSDSIESNLALKVNIKLRGQCHKVAFGTGKEAVLAFANISPDTIVIGADVSHAPSKMPHCPSVAAVVGSDDANFANFPGSMRLQASKQEIIEDLADMVCERVVRYCKLRGQAPRRMIFFRDGVGEDQFAAIRDLEFPQINAGINAALKGPKNNVELTFIVVGKRHNTRFFCGAGTPQSKTGNVAPGLLVEQVITRPTTEDVPFDFFLQSHEALQGTAKSGHYVVLQKGASFTPDALHTLTHAFCYNYARATKGVSYAGPAYYADRLCDRGTHYLRAFTAGKTAPPYRKLP